MPETPLAGRSFRDAMDPAEYAEMPGAFPSRVIFMAAGLPLVMKDRPALAR